MSCIFTSLRYGQYTPHALANSNSDIACSYIAVYLVECSLAFLLLKYCTPCVLSTEVPASLLHDSVSATISATAQFVVQTTDLTVQCLGNYATL